MKFTILSSSMITSVSRDGKGEKQLQIVIPVKVFNKYRFPSKQCNVQ